LAVSLRDTNHSAQMRCSIAFAVVSSGAALSAPNRKSRLCRRSPRETFGRSLGGSIHSGRCGGCGCCADAGATNPDAKAAAKAEAATSARNRERMGEE